MKKWLSTLAMTCAATFAFIAAPVHAAAAPSVAVHLLPDRVHVEVADDDETAHLEPREAPPSAEGGRGLLLVEALADCWGQVTLPGGKVVWFEIDPDDSRQPAFALDAETLAELGELGGDPPPSTESAAGSKGGPVNSVRTHIFI